MPREKMPRAFVVSKNILRNEKPDVVFAQIFDFMAKDSKQWDKSGITCIGDMIYTYTRPQDVRTTTVALTDARVNVRILIFGNTRFDGWVLSLDEFKLIWERIL